MRFERAAGGARRDPAVLLKHEIVGRNKIFVGNDSRLQGKLAGRLECVGGGDEIGGETAREEVARRT